MKYNVDPNFWDLPHKDCNCGSLAFDLDEWYHPGSLTDSDSETFVYEQLEEWQNEGLDDDEIANYLAELYLSRIEKDFGNRISPITYMIPALNKLDANDEVIAFRAGAYVWDSDIFDHDFHFKVYRNHGWIEKNGGGAVHRTTIDNWEDGCMYYNSETFYFIHHRENLTDIKNFDIIELKEN